MAVELSDPKFTQDEFLGGLVNVRQPAKGYRAGLDSVFLAASIAAKPGQKILELGMGAGIAALCLAARIPKLDITGVELQSALCNLARDNARQNDFEGAFKVIEADLGIGLQRLESLGLVANSFDHIFVNPPFYDEARVRRPPNQAKAKAHSFAEGDLEHWIKLMVAMAAPRGTITMIHRADMLGEILRGFERRLGAITATPLHAYEDGPANRIIVRGIKGSRGPFSLNRGLVLHQADGEFSEQAKSILRHGEAFLLT